MGSGSRRAGMPALSQFACRYQGRRAFARGLDHEESRWVDPPCFLPLVLFVVRTRLRIGDDRSQIAGDISRFPVECECPRAAEAGANEPNSGGIEPRKARRARKGSRRGRENHERHEGHEREMESGGWGVRPDEGGEQESIPAGEDHESDESHESAGRENRSEWEVAAGRMHFRDAAGWLSDSSADSSDSSDSWSLLLFLVLCVGGRLRMRERAQFLEVIFTQVHNPKGKTHVLP